MLNVATLEAFMKARGWSRSELARRVGVSRQAVSLWFRGPEAHLKGRHLVKLSEVLGVSVEQLSRSLPCLDPETRTRLRATLLWDHLFPDVDDLVVALNAKDPRALGRFVEVYGLYAAESALGPFVWDAFPDYERFIHTARRRQLEILWSWHRDRRAA